MSGLEDQREGTMYRESWKMKMVQLQGKKRVAI
jgi:hypothetical protein